MKMYLTGFWLFAIFVAMPSILFGLDANSISESADKIPLDGVVVTGIGILFAFLAEIAVRLWPTVKPRSILIAIAAFCVAIGKFLDRVGKFLSAVAGKLDGVVPQRLTEKK